MDANCWKVVSNARTEAGTLAARLQGEYRVLKEEYIAIGLRMKAAKDALALVMEPLVEAREEAARIERIRCLGEALLVRREESGKRAVSAVRDLEDKLIDAVFDREEKWGEGLVDRRLSYDERHARLAELALRRYLEEYAG